MKKLTLLFAFVAIAFLSVAQLPVDSVALPDLTPEPVIPFWVVIAANMILALIGFLKVKQYAGRLGKAVLVLKAFIAMVSDGIVDEKELQNLAKLTKDVIAKEKELKVLAKLAQEIVSKEEPAPATA